MAIIVRLMTSSKRQPVHVTYTIRASYQLVALSIQLETFKVLLLIVRRKNSLHLTMIRQVFRSVIKLLQYQHIIQFRIYGALG